MRLGGSGPWSDAGLVTVAVLPMLALLLMRIAAARIPIVAYRLWFAMALLWFVAGLVLVARFRTRQLRLVASLLQGLREGDYGLRIRVGGGPVGEVWREFNALAARLGGEQRHGLETDALLAQLLASLELAVLIVDEQDRLVEFNPAAEALLGETAAGLAGRAAADLGLSDWLQRGAPFIDRRDFLAGEGPWEVRRVMFRRHGRPHRLLVVTDVSRALREEERHAWRRLIRVLGHEINNSLGSIQSTAGLLRERAAEGDPTLKEGMELIERRSRTLGGFIRRYAELARLPPPNPEVLDLSGLVRHIATLEDRVAVTVESDSPANAYVDRTQFEQALINVVRNAAEAALETGGDVRIRWREDGRYLLIEVEDDGPGLAYTENLFVPFFTTKPGGSGIGLVLARQIIEAHGGSLRLANRQDSPGARAVIRLAKKE